MEYLSLTAAQHCILQHTTILGVESIPLEKSLGRVLAEAVSANRDHPPYAVSAMDGYALRAADLHSIPATLDVIEDIKAGAMPTKMISTRQCARIMTGAPIPPGADTVIRVEGTQLKSDDAVQVNQSAKPGEDIRLRGENLRNGEVVFNAGVEITPGVLGILAMVKRTEILVHRRPRVAILSSGDELEGLHEPFDQHKIPDANSYTLMAQAQALGIEPALLGIARDDAQELSKYLKRGLEFDVLLVSGGTSVGVYDFVRPALEALGVQMHFWRVAIRPGHPFAFGVKTSPAKVVEVDAAQGARRAATQAYLADRPGCEHLATPRCAASDTFVFCLPGNPVSSMVCFEQFVAPALRSMMGHPRVYRRTLMARLSHAIQHRPGRTDLVRVVLNHEAHGYVAEATGSQGSGVLLSMAHADGLLHVPSESNGLAAGSEVCVQLLDGTDFQEHSGLEESA
jgi:molybdopterin molybdotransferase